MRVLLVAPNRLTFPQRVTPCGALYLAAALRNKGHSVRVLDLMFSSDVKGDIERKIHDFNPDLVGVSIRNMEVIVKHDKYLVPDIELCVKTIKENTQSPVIIGGAAFNMYPKEFVTRLDVDFGIVGEADIALPSFVERLESRDDYSDIPGLLYYKDGELISNPTAILDNVDVVPFQAMDLIDYKQYMKNIGYFGVFTTRSCSQKCIFCTERHIYGKRVRCRSAARVVDEIEYLKNTTGMIYFDFCDPLFNSHPTHMLEVCNELARRKLGIKFTVEINPIGQNEESVKLLKAAGCIGVSFTAESGSDRMLKALRKGYDSQSCYEIASLFAKHDIPYAVGFLLGGPGENLESVEESLGLAHRLPKAGAIYVATGIRIHKGSPLEKIASSELDGEKSRDIFEPAYYLSPDFDGQCAARLLQASRKNPRIYLAEMFYDAITQRILSTADRINLRPAWKYGMVPNIVNRLIRLGKDSVYWNDEARQFCCVNEA